MTTTFDDAFAAFYTGVQKIHEDYMIAQFPNNQREPWRVDTGPKYAKVVHGDAVYCFVDKTNGNVLKAAGWKTPAKHARGNIYDEANGLKFMGPYGPAYLR
jgi:hypothetical protein